MARMSAPDLTETTPPEVKLASRLSALQKRVLVYAHRQMIAKGQIIRPADSETTTVVLAAPPWLQDAVLSRARRGHARPDGGGW